MAAKTKIQLLQEQLNSCRRVQINIMKDREEAYRLHVLEYEWRLKAQYNVEKKLLGRLNKAITEVNRKDCHEKE